MAKGHGIGYTLGFGLVLSAACALLLAGVCFALKSKIQRNEAMHELRQTLAVLRAGAPAELTAEDVDEWVGGLSAEKVEELVSGLEEVTRLGAPGGDDEQIVFRNPADGAIAVPLRGRGLWGPVRGVLALEPDGRTIRGVRFYKHAETPGLGGIIGETNWAQRWEKGKVLNGEPRFVVIVKPGEADQPHEIDGITAATMTGDKVTDLVNESIARFRAAMEGAQP